MSQSSINKEKLAARVVIRMPNYRPDTEEKFPNQLVFTVRPDWSKQGADMTALVGGQIEAQDFQPPLEEDEIPSEERLIAAALIRVIIEALVEIDLVMEASLLKYVGIFESNAGWLTVAFALDMQRRVDLKAPKESNGVIWVNEEKIKAGDRELFSDHLAISQIGISLMDTQISATV